MKMDYIIFIIGVFLVQIHCFERGEFLLGLSFAALWTAQACASFSAGVDAGRKIWKGSGL